MKSLSQMLSLNQMIVLICCCVGQLQAGGLVLVNEQVPAAMPLVEQYRQLHGLTDLKVLALDCPPTEGVAMKVVLEELLPAIRDAVLEFQPDWILTLYGLPVWVQDGERKRSLDQLIALCLEDAPKGDQLVLSPLFFKDAPSDRVVVPVTRLDAPTLAQTQMILEAWARLKNWGGFRRAFPLDVESGVAHRFRSAGQWVHGMEHFSAVDLSEVQWLEGLDGHIGVGLQGHARSESFAPGAMVVRYHSGSHEDLPLRQRRGSVAQVLGRGASFFVGALAPRSSEEDLFDAELFLSRYLRGESFIKSVYGATPILGGSLLICGDPLATPYSEEWEQMRESAFSQSVGAETKPTFVAALNQGRMWWLLRDLLKKWDEGQFKMVQTLAQVAIQTHGAPLFRELQCWSWFQMGKGEAFDRAWQTWPSEARSPWIQHLMSVEWNVPRPSRIHQEK